jgi:hypothetical protein
MQDNHDDAWDRLCVNPHQEELESGRDEGGRAGQQAGWEEGCKLGRTTAINYGMEVGFIRGCSRAISLALQGEDVITAFIGKEERLKKSLRELERALEDFPGAEAFFSRDTTRKENDAHQIQRPEHDVSEKLQRIRARFKVLTVQLGIPDASLKKAMAQVSSSSSAPQATNQTTQSEIPTTDW